MQDEDLVTTWLPKLAEGNQEAAEAVWHKFFDKLVRLAQRRLANLPRRTADEEDVALSAMNSFFRAAQAGRFPQLANRDDLWKVLFTITARKVVAQQRRHFADKRGGGLVRGESVFLQVEDENEGPGIAQMVGAEPTPELAAELTETCQRLLDSLDDETLREIALLRLEGYTNDEIAERIKCTTRSVERKLNRIRSVWSKGHGSESA